MNKKQKYKMEQQKLMKYLSAKHKELCANIITDPEKLKQFSKLYQDNFHNYSLRNTILAWVQYPEMSLLSSYNDWIKRGRHVMKGEKGLRIFAPNTYKRTVTDNDGNEKDEWGISGFRTVAVFDVAQTGVASECTIPTGITYKYSNPWPYDLTGVNIGNEDYIIAPQDLKFDYFAKTSMVNVKINPKLGFANAETGGANIDIAPKDNEGSKINSLFHEEMHIGLGHTKKDCNVDREIREICAEAGAYLISSFFGIENTKASYYIGGWNGDKSKLEDHGREVIKCAEKIIKMHMLKMEELGIQIEKVATATA